MKINWNTNYTTISAYSFVVVCLSILFYQGLSNFETIKGGFDVVIATLQPFFIGFAIAYLLNFILEFLEIKILSKTNIKGKRAISIIGTYAIAFLMLALFIQFVLPQLVDSIVGLVNNIPAYVNDLNILINQFMTEMNLSEEMFVIATDKWNEFVDIVIQIATNLLPVLGNMVKSTASGVWNVLLGLIISIYMLIDKENFFAQIKKLTYGMLPNKKADKAIELTHRANYTFGKFLSGKIIDSAIIGVLTFVLLTIFKMPYVLLVSVIIGVTNIIPFFGPFIGAIPATIIILFVSPIKAVWFVVLIIIIQQLDGNIIGPKILGDSIGISAFWILFSILVAGKFLGLMGMIIGVPLFAFVYSIIKEVIEYELDKKGLPVDTEEYR